MIVLIGTATATASNHHLLSIGSFPEHIRHVVIFGIPDEGASASAF
jgi:hypothetical protein